MPVVRIHGRERPDNTLQSKTFSNMRILGDVGWIIEANEGIARYPGIENDAGYSEQQCDSMIDVILIC
jgi:hypothetical protein